MKEIGGYIDFETYRGKMLHEDGILLNCGRSCLALLIETKHISKIAIPFFMCETVVDLCKRYGVSVRRYHIGWDFLPILDGQEADEWVYIADYYGQMQPNDIQGIVGRFDRVIFDFAQDYFHEPVYAADSLYTCRKFFGVPDGAVLYTDMNVDNINQYAKDESYNRMNFLLGRFERKASEFYKEYVDNNEMFIEEPIKRMSKLTKNLLRAIDYDFVKEQRKRNFLRLHDALKSYNRLDVQAVDGAFAYPLYLENGAEMRKRLISKLVYVPTLWPNVIEEMPIGSVEYQMARNILPLPCDQRYVETDMEYIIEEVLNGIDD